MQAICGGHKQVQRRLLVLSKIASCNLRRWDSQHEKTFQTERNPLQYFANENNLCEVFRV